MNQAWGHLNLIHGVSHPGACHQVSSPPAGGTDGLAEDTVRAQTSTNATGLQEESSLPFRHCPQGGSQSPPGGRPRTLLPRMEQCLFVQPCPGHVKWSLTNQPSWPWGRSPKMHCAAGALGLGPAICCPDRDLGLSVTTSHALLRVPFLPNQQLFHPTIISNFCTLFWSQMDRRDTGYFKASQQSGGWPASHGSHPGARPRRRWGVPERD